MAHALRSHREWYQYRCRAGKYSLDSASLIFHSLQQATGDKSSDNEMTLSYKLVDL